MSLFKYWGKSRLRRRTLLLATLGVSAMLIIIGVSDYLSLRESTQERLKERLVLAAMVAGNLEYLLLENMTYLQNFSFFPGVNLEDNDTTPERIALHAVALQSICSSVFFAQLIRTARME